MGPNVKALGIDQLSVADRMLLVEEIWDSLVDEAKALESLRFRRDERDRRLAAHQAAPPAGSSAESGTINRPEAEAINEYSGVKTMETETTIEARLKAAEEAIELLKREMEVRPPVTNWLDKFIGAFDNEPAFEEVIRLGREFRMSDYPEEDSGP